MKWAWFSLLEKKILFPASNGAAKCIIFFTLRHHVFMQVLKQNYINVKGTIYIWSYPKAQNTYNMIGGICPREDSNSHAPRVEVGQGSERRSDALGWFGWEPPLRLNPRLPVVFSFPFLWLEVPDPWPPPPSYTPAWSTVICLYIRHHDHSLMSP